MSKKKPEKKPRPKSKSKKKDTSLQIVEVAKPGKYGITAPDLLQSIALRKNLQASIEKMKKVMRDFAKQGLETGTITEEDVQVVLEQLDEVDGAIVPIAYGIDEEDGEDGGG